MSVRLQLFRRSVGAVALLLLTAVSLAAQGFYYKEIAKDGRIYVFNNAANAERFEKTGEMGIGITKPGSDRTARPWSATTSARCSVFFKHGISEPVPDPVAPVQTIVWRDGRRGSPPTTPTWRSRTACRSGSPRNFPTTNNTQLTGHYGKEIPGVRSEPPRQVQARGLDDSLLADLRGANELAGDHRESRCVPGRCRVRRRLFQGARSLSRAHRAVQAPWRTGADVVWQSAVC